MFYWDCERPLFEEDGGRKNRNILQDNRGTSMLLVSQYVQDGVLSNGNKDWNDGGGAKLRQAFYEQGQGTYPTTSEHPGDVPFTMLFRCRTKGRECSVLTMCMCGSR
jgi:hypothetical protein